MQCGFGNFLIDMILRKKIQTQTAIASSLSIWGDRKSTDEIAQLSVISIPKSGVYFSDEKSFITLTSEVCIIKILCS